MRKIAILAAFVATLLLAPACASAQVGQIDGRIASTFGGEIDTSAKANGYVLTYQSSSGKWIAAAGGGGFSPTITTPATGDLLRYNGAAWVNVTTSTVLDTVGSTRGSVLYRGASGWAILSPGTSGYFLKSNGAGADPSWASAGGGGGFDPAAATAITFSLGEGDIKGADGPSTDEAGDSLGLRGGTGNGAGNGGDGSVSGGVAGPTGRGGDGVVSGGTSTDGNSGGIRLYVPDASGTNRSARPVTITLGNKTGSGTASFLDVQGASSATVFKVTYDGVLTFASNSTGAQTATLGTNGPMTTTTPYTWQKVTTADGSTGYVPIWK